MEASISDVARAANVSVSTVSRSFTRPSAVAPSTREKVLGIAKELDFSISRSAAMLKSGRSMRIALLMSGDLRLWFSASVVEGLNQIFHPQGYDLLIFQISSINERREFFETIPVRRNADAVIVISLGIDQKEVAKLLNIGVPIVGINCDSPEETGFTAAVNIDDDQGSILAARHLLNLGHRNLVYLRTSRAVSLHFSVQRRYESFMKCCADNGVSPLTITTDGTADGISRIVSKLSALAEFPSAVACQEDAIAVPLLFRLTQSGYQVPSALSLIGYDDGLYAQDVGLTTIRQRPLDLAHHAALMTLDLIHGKRPGAHPFQVIPAELVLRATTARFASATAGRQH